MKDLFARLLRRKRQEGPVDVDVQLPEEAPEQLSREAAVERAEEVESTLRSMQASTREQGERSLPRELFQRLIEAMRQLRFAVDSADVPVPEVTGRQLVQYALLSVLAVGAARAVWPGEAYAGNPWAERDAAQAPPPPTVPAAEPARESTIELSPDGREAYLAEVLQQLALESAEEAAVRNARPGGLVQRAGEAVVRGVRAADETVSEVLDPSESVESTGDRIQEDAEQRKSEQDAREAAKEQAAKEAELLRERTEGSESRSAELPATPDAGLYTELTKALDKGKVEVGGIKITFTDEGKARVEGLATNQPDPDANRRMLRDDHEAVARQGGDASFLNLENVYAHVNRLDSALELRAMMLRAGINEDHPQYGKYFKGLNEEIADLTEQVLKLSGHVFRPEFDPLSGRSRTQQ